MKLKKLLPVLVAFIVAVCSVAFAEDIIRLTNGQELRGKIIDETGDSIILRGKYGEQEIKRDEIESIERGFDFDGEFKKRAAGIGAKDSTGWYELGLWCEEYKNQEKAKECFQKAIEADSEHPAREKLGHRKYQGRWYESEEEYYAARGWVNHAGVWMPRDDADKYKAGLVKRDDGTWVSKKTWDVEEKRRRAERLRKKEQERKEKEARGEKVEEDPGKDESGDAGAAIRRRMGSGGRRNPVPKDKGARKKWLESFMQKGGWTRHHESRHYLFVSTGPAEKIKHFAKVMDCMYKEYCRIFAFKEKQEQPFLVTLHGSQSEFCKKERKSRGVGGFYDGARIACFLGRAGSLNTQTVLFHEGTHQFQGLVWPGMLRMTGVPGAIWMIEGLATYFECAQIVGGGKIATGQINKGRLGTLRGAMARNRYTKLSDLIRMTQRGYSAFHYAHGWGLCYFLIHADSKLRKKFKEYFKEFKKPNVKPVESFKRIFPYDEEKMDQQWKNYIRTLR